MYLLNSRILFVFKSKTKTIKQSLIIYSFEPFPNFSKTKGRNIKHFFLKKGAENGKHT